MNDADAQGIAALRSILALERKQGFGDKAVVGGMDRFLEQWAGRLAPIIGNPPSYSSLSSERREQWATHVPLPAACIRRSSDKTSTSRPGVVPARRSTAAPQVE